MKKYLTCKY